MLITIDLVEVVSHVHSPFGVPQLDFCLDVRFVFVTPFFFLLEREEVHHEFLSGCLFVAHIEMVGVLGMVVVQSGVVSLLYCSGS